MKKALLLFILIGFCYTANSQNRVFDKAEAVNFGILDLATVNNPAQWTTTRTERPGMFSNYSEATFINDGSILGISSNPQNWVNGYVKHYATSASVKHLYPVGNDNQTMFLSTENETPGQSIAVAWFRGSPEVLEDLTEPYAGVHHTAFLPPGIVQIKSIGYWDWMGSYEIEKVNVKVKLPAGDENKSHLRLVGWSNGGWHLLGISGSDSQGILMGEVPPNYSALAIGSTSLLLQKNENPSNIALSEIKSLATNKLIDKTLLAFFKMYPNPVQSGRLTLDYNIAYSGNARITLYDVLGKMIFTQEIIVNEGNNVHTLDISMLAKGLYTLQIQDASNTILINPKKLIIQ